MKIALVCPYDWSRPGGVRVHVESLARHLSGDHEVRVFAPASEPVADHDVEVLGRPVPVRINASVAPVALTPTAWRRTVRALKAFDPHIVHVHEPLAPAVSLAASARGPKPVVGTFHAWSEDRRLYRSMAPAVRRVASDLSVRIAVSPAALDFHSTALGLAPAAFRVIPNGVDRDGFCSADPIDELVDPERPLALFVGRLEPRKGLDVAVRAFLRLRAANPAVRLCVVGDGPERRRCQDMVPPSARPDVLFMGQVTGEDLPSFHASADVFWAPARGGESFGIVLLEAMAAGLPVVASDIPGYRTVMVDGRQGRLVPPGDAVALAEAAGSLLGNPHLSAAMAAQGRETAAAHAWPVVGERILEVYRAARAAG